MAVVALGFAAEELISPLRRSRIEIAAGLRFGGRQRELIEMQARQLLRDLIILRREVFVDLREAVRRGNRKSGRIVRLTALGGCERAFEVAAVQMKGGWGFKLAQLDFGGSGRLKCGVLGYEVVFAILDRRCKAQECLKRAAMHKAATGVLRRLKAERFDVRVPAALHGVFASGGWNGIAVPRFDANSS